MAVSLLSDSKSPPTLELTVRTGSVGARNLLALFSLPTPPFTRPGNSPFHSLMNVLSNTRHNHKKALFTIYLQGQNNSEPHSFLSSWS